MKFLFSFIVFFLFQTSYLRIQRKLDLDNDTSEKEDPYGLNSQAESVESTDEENQDEQQEKSEESEETQVEKFPEEYISVSEEQDEDELGEIQAQQNEEKSFQLEMIKDLNEIRDKYIKCLQDLKPKKFLKEEKRLECYGQNFIKLMFDIKYYMMQKISKKDQRIKDIFKTGCYEKAGMNKYFQVGCDKLETDVLDFFWKGFNFIKLIKNNKKKYLSVHGKIHGKQWKKILEKLETLITRHWKEVKQINEAKDKIIVEVKIYMDERFKLIEDGEDNEDGAVLGAKNLVHDFQIEQIQQEVPEKPKADLVDGNFQKEISKK